MKSKYETGKNETGKKQSDFIFSRTVREDAALRASFNELTRKTFDFDFTGWYSAGHWGEYYIPHVLLDGGRVVSNVSVNRMPFEIGGRRKNFIQLGTVMTEEDYRGQGLNRRLMERILEEYKGRADGIYLFGNDSVLDYYPRFGFRPAREYEYYLPRPRREKAEPYRLEKVDMSCAQQRERLYELIRNYPQGTPNPNDGMYMDENLGLYQFWLDGEFGGMVYYLPENRAFVVAGMEEGRLMLHQVFGGGKVEPLRLAAAFEEDMDELVLGYTPADRGQFCVREHKSEDCTLFLLGEELECVEREKMMFPVLSHA